MLDLDRMGLWISFTSTRTEAGTKTNQSYFSQWCNDSSFLFFFFFLCKNNSLLSNEVMGIFSWKKSYIREQTQSQLFRKGRYACTTTSPVTSTFCLAVATIDLQSFIFTSMQFFVVFFFWKLQAALYTFFPIIHILRKLLCFKSIYASE